MTEHRRNQGKNCQKKEAEKFTKFKKVSHLSCTIVHGTKCFAQICSFIPLLHNKTNFFLLKYVAKVNSIV